MEDLIVQIDEETACCIVSQPTFFGEIRDLVPIVAAAHVRVGEDCLIGTHVMVMDCDFHRVEDKSWDTTGEPIVLEPRVWLGNRSIILKGARASAGADTQFVDLMTYVNGKLRPRA